MTMITITGSVLDIAGHAAGETLRFTPRTHTVDHLSQRHIDIESNETTGAFTTQLHPGPMTVSINSRTPIAFTVPDTTKASGDGSYTLWELIQANLTIPATTPQDIITAAVAGYLANTTSLLTKTTADATYSPLTPNRIGGYESPAVRRARTQLGACATGGFGFLNNNWVFRLPFLPTVNAQAFSIVFANRWSGDPFNAAGVGTGVVTVNSVWIAQAAVDANGQPNGQFVAGTSRQVSASITMPTNGSDTATAWITDYPLTAGKLYLISYGVTQDGANYAEASNICWFAGTAANAGQNAPSGLAPYMASTLDVRIDYRHGTEPSGLWIGPSIMQGLSNGLLNGSLVGGAWGWLNYPVRASLARQHAVQCAAIKSSQYGNFTSGTDWRWVRAAIATQNIDYVVVGECGTNNAIAATALATSIADLRSLLTYIRAQLPGRPIYVATNTPTSTLASGKLTTAIAANGTSVVSDTDLGASGVAVRVGVGMQAETRTTSAKSGSGPWTYTVPALTYAHPVGERVQGPQDLIRQTINDMVIAGQFDCDGIIDLAAAVADPTKPQQQSLDVVDKDWIHTTPVGQVRLRDAALAAIPA